MLCLTTLTNFYISLAALCCLHMTLVLSWQMILLNVFDTKIMKIHLHLANCSTPAVLPEEIAMYETQLNQFRVVAEEDIIKIMMST